MADVQTQFIEFHDAIKLGTYEENSTLQNKRDEVVKALREGLKRDFKARGETPPDFRSFGQGSYAMKTGIKPIKAGDYDIDVGIGFCFSAEDYDPLEVKKWVYEALEDQHQTKRVEIRRPCVTVFYLKNDGSGDTDYHVDLALYAGGSEGKTPRHLAKGKRHSGDDHVLWEEADPEGLKDKIQGWSSDSEDRRQFRRAIRALKRWKNQRFSSGSPTGIALTIAAYRWFQARSSTDLTNGSRKDHDLKAIVDWVSNMLNQFQSVWNSDEQVYFKRLQVSLPTQPYNDLLEKLTDRQSQTFYDKLEALKSALEQARDASSRKEACVALRAQFGPDFPVPEDNAQKDGASGSRTVQRVIVNSGQSA